VQLTNPINRYGVTPQFLHWLTVILVLTAWTLGTFGDDLPKGAARDAGLFVHISAGLLFLTALIMRLAWRVVEPPPP
jgi:cytochrome b561